MQTGLLLSGTPSHKVHYDWAFVSGDGNTGQTLPQSGVERWGSILNIRYMPGAAVFGLSGSYHKYSPAKTSKPMASIYTIVSLGRWTDDRIPLSVTLEHSRANNRGDHLGQGFVADSVYAQSLKATQSTAWLVRFDYQLNQRLVLIYKYDMLTPDRNYPSDVYDRHGLGLRWAIAANTLVQARTELARATHPKEKSGAAIGGQNATYAILQLAF
jgi:hypothetical protein